MSKIYEIKVNIVHSGELYRLALGIERFGKVYSYTSGQIYVEIDDPEKMHQLKVFLTRNLGPNNYSIEPIESKFIWKPIEAFERIFVDKPALWMFILSCLQEFRYSNITEHNLMNYVESKIGKKPGKFTLKASLLMLKRAGLIDDSKQYNGRKYYRITEKGKVVYARAISKLTSIFESLYRP